MKPRVPGGFAADRSHGRRRPGERGASMVEFILVIQLLLVVIFGIVECGRLMLTYSTLAKAARAGTRYAMVHGSYRKGGGAYGPSGPGNISNVVTEVKRLTTAAGLAETEVTVVDSDAEPMYPDGSNGVGKLVRVKVTYPFRVIVPLIPIPPVTLGSTSEGAICY